MYNQIDSNKRKTWLLMIIFFIVIVILGWVIGEIYNLGYAGIILAAFLAIIMNLFGYFNGDKVALSVSGAQAIKKEDNPYVYRLVENLCITAGLPLPKIYLIDDPNINAFATGRKPENSSIAITTGAIAKLENEELEGVIAHELSHIKNYDIRLMTIVIICVGIVTLIADFFLRAQFFFGGHRNRDNNQAGAVLMIVGLVLAILSPIFATLIQLAVSRKGEYLADASGVLLTRYPEGLARALEKISAQNQQPMRRANHATAHLYISNPFKTIGKKTGSLFSTHPPIEDRVAKLRQMA